MIAGSDRVYLTGVTAYRDHLAISSRVDGLDQLVLRTYAGEETRIPFAEASYSAFFIGNPEFAPDAYRARLFVDGHADDDLRLSSRTAARSRCARSRKFRRATTRRNMRPSG